jgi:hypothetical protein
MCGDAAIRESSPVGNPTTEVVPAVFLRTRVRHVHRAGHRSDCRAGAAHGVRDVRRVGDARAVWHHSRAHRFFATTRWSPDQVGLVVLSLVIGWLVPAGAPLIVAMDDTLFRRRGPKVAAIVVTLPFLDRPIALPVLARLWRPAGPTKTTVAREFDRLDRYGRSRPDRSRGGRQRLHLHHAATPSGQRDPHRAVAASRCFVGGPPGVRRSAVYAWPAGSIPHPRCEDRHTRPARHHDARKVGHRDPLRAHPHRGPARAALPVVRRIPLSTSPRDRNSRRRMTSSPPTR